MYGMYKTPRTLLSHRVGSIRMKVFLLTYSFIL